MISSEDCEFIQRFEMKRSPEEKQEMLQTEGSQVISTESRPRALPWVVRHSRDFLSDSLTFLLSKCHSFTKNSLLLEGI